MAKEKRKKSRGKKRARKQRSIAEPEKQTFGDSGLPTKESKQPSNIGPWAFGGLKEGKSKYPSYRTTFPVYTIEAARTHQEQMVNSLWQFREMTSMLTAAGQGAVIGTITDLILKAIRDAMSHAQTISARADRAIRSEMEAYGEEVGFELRNLGEPHICKIVSSGPLSKEMMRYVIEMDRAIVRLKLSYSAGVIPHGYLNRGTVELIQKSRSVYVLAKALRVATRDALKRGAPEQARWEELLNMERARLQKEAPVPDEQVSDLLDSLQSEVSTDTPPPSKKGASPISQQKSQQDKKTPKTPKQDQPAAGSEEKTDEKKSVGGILRSMIKQER